MYLKEVKRVQKGVQGEQMRVEDRDETMLVEKKTVMHRWAEHFNKLLNVRTVCRRAFCR